MYLKMAMLHSLDLTFRTNTLEIVPINWYSNQLLYQLITIVIN